jgi:hypothetical protein
VGVGNGCAFVTLGDDDLIIVDIGCDTDDYDPPSEKGDHVAERPGRRLVDDLEDDVCRVWVHPRFDGCNNLQDFHDNEECKCDAWQILNYDSIEDCKSLGWGWILLICLCSLVCLVGLGVAVAAA